MAIRQRKRVGISGFRIQPGVTLSKAPDSTLAARFPIEESGPFAHQAGSGLVQPNRGPSPRDLWNLGLQDSPAIESGGTAPRSIGLA